MDMLRDGPMRAERLRGRGRLLMAAARTRALVAGADTALHPCLRPFPPQGLGGPAVLLPPWAISRLVYSNYLMLKGALGRRFFEQPHTRHHIFDEGR